MTPLIPLLEGHLQPKTIFDRIRLKLLGKIGTLYGLIQCIRVYLYQKQLIKSYQPPCRVISVGNLSAGGTGKTPMVLWLARELLKRQKKIAIVSRGYGVHCSQPITIVADEQGIRLTPPQAADEATLLAQNLHGVPVLTGPKRSDLIHYAHQHYQSEIVLMDDGFQHLHVKRDLDLLLLDAQHPFGNGQVLPGGILREFPKSLHRSHAIILTRAHSVMATQTAKKHIQKIAPNLPILRADHQPGSWIELKTQKKILPIPLETIPVLAFCGIARPDSFFKCVDNSNLSILGHQQFPDHFPFSQKELANLTQKARTLNAQALICTEKDAVKIQPDWLELPLYFLSIDFLFLEKPTWLTEQLDLL